MLRRLATCVAVTTMVAAAATVPALASHGSPAPAATLDGNVNSCSELEQSGALEADFDAHRTWNESPDANAEHPNHVVHTWWDASYGDAYGNVDSSLDIVLTQDAPTGTQLAVLVKAGSDTNVFVNMPGEDLIGLYAPEVGAEDKHPTISNYTVCKLGDTPPTPTPTPTETPTPTPTVTVPSPSPSPTVTVPVPVPTEVPAGHEGPDDSSLGTVGLLAGATVLTAGAAVLVRRRFLSDS